MNYAISIKTINALDVIQPKEGEDDAAFEKLIEEAYGKEIVQIVMLDEDRKQQLVTVSPYYSATSEGDKFAMVSRMLKRCKTSIVERERAAVGKIALNGHRK